MDENRRILERSIDISTLLVLIVDVDSDCWDQHAREFVQDTQAGSSHHHTNPTIQARVHISFEDFVKTRAESSVIFPDLKSTAPSSSSASLNDSLFLPVRHSIGRIVVENLLKAKERTAAGSESTAVVSDRSHRRIDVSACLARAMCVIHKQMQLDFHRQIQTRIISFQVDSDNPKSYNCIMNSLFSAQKIGVQIDGVILSKSESSFFQQACHLTQGIYSFVVNQRSLLSLLLAHHLPNNALRSVLKTPMQKSIDLKLTCSCCNGKAVDFAYLCSVCLTATCSAPEQCRVCFSTSKKQKLSSSQS